MEKDKIAYVCGPLTELPKDMAEVARRIYVAIANLTEEIFSKRAFVPHEHFDPLVNSTATAQDVYNTESDRIKNKTSFLVVVAIAPSWGGGGEIQLANENGIPVVILKPRGKNISRYILGMPMIKDVIEYDDEEDLLYGLRLNLENSNF